MTDEIYEVTLKRHHPNLLDIVELAITFENLTRAGATIRAEQIAVKLGLTFDMQYIIRRGREEG